MKTASVTTMIALILSMMLTLGCSGAPPPTVATDVARIVHDGCLLVVDLQVSAAATEVCETETDLYPLVTAALAAAETATHTHTQATPAASPALVIGPSGRSAYLLPSAKSTVALVRERRVDR